MRAQARGQGPCVGEGQARAQPQLRTHRVRRVTDQHQPGFPSNEGRRADHDISIRRLQDPRRRRPFDERSQATGVWARSLDPRGRSFGDDRRQPLGRGRPEERRLVDPGREHAKRDAGPVIALVEDVAGQMVGVRHHGPDRAIRVPDILAGQTAHAPDAGSRTIRADDEIERALAPRVRSRVANRRVMASGHRPAGRSWSGSRRPGPRRRGDRTACLGGHPSRRTRARGRRSRSRAPAGRPSFERRSAGPASSKPRVHRRGPARRALAGQAPGAGSPPLPRSARRRARRSRRRGHRGRAARPRPTLPCRRRPPRSSSAAAHKRAIHR